MRWEIKIRKLASTGREFTASDVDKNATRALGTAFLRLKREGVIRPVGFTEYGERDVSHGQRVRVWVGVAA